MRLKAFKCTGCDSIDMIAGGTSGHLCNPCHVAAGGTPGRSPQSVAHYLVAQAIRKGKLQRPADFPCEDCGGISVEYDHRDYSKPLMVAPVCRRCNLARGSAIGSNAARA